MGEMTGPFRASEAVSKGWVSEHYVRTKCVRLMPGVHMPKGMRLTARRRAMAVATWSRRRLTLCGFSAAAMWGTKWIDDDEAAECISACKLRAPAGVIIRRDRLGPGDIWRERGIPVTSPVRTAFDLGRRLPMPRAVAVVDALYQTRLLRKSELADYADAHPNMRGIRQLRTVIELSDEGAQSPQETRTRLAILDAGLPRPSTQVTILDAANRFVAQVDLCWPQWRVVVEYDGDDHLTRKRQAKDMMRVNALGAIGWTVIKVKAELLADPRKRAIVIEQIRGALRQAGAPV